MAIFWPKKWSQGPEKKKKFFSFFYLWNPKTKKPPFYFFDFLFFCRFFGEKCQFFRVFSAKKAPSGRFMSTPPVPQVYHIDLSQKNGQKWQKKFCAPKMGVSTHSVLQREKVKIEDCYLGPKDQRKHWSKFLESRPSSTILWSKSLDGSRYVQPWLIFPPSAFVVLEWSVAWSL